MAHFAECFSVSNTQHHPHKLGDGGIFSHVIVFLAAGRRGPDPNAAGPEVKNSDLLPLSFVSRYFILGSSLILSSGRLLQ